MRQQMNEKKETAAVAPAGEEEVQKKEPPINEE